MVDWWWLLGAGRTRDRRVGLGLVVGVGLLVGLGDFAGDRLGVILGLLAALLGLGGRFGGLLLLLALVLVLGLGHGVLDIVGGEIGFRQVVHVVGKGALGLLDFAERIAERSRRGLVVFGNEFPGDATLLARADGLTSRLVGILRGIREDIGEEVLLVELADVFGHDVLDGVVEFRLDGLEVLGELLDQGVVVVAGDGDGNATVRLEIVRLAGLDQGLIVRGLDELLAGMDESLGTTTDAPAVNPSLGLLLVRLRGLGHAVLLDFLVALLGDGSHQRTNDVQQRGGETGAKVPLIALGGSLLVVGSVVLHRGDDADAGADFDERIRVARGEFPILAEDALQIADGGHLRNGLDVGGVGELHGLFSFLPLFDLGERLCGVWNGLCRPVGLFYHD